LTKHYEHSALKMNLGYRPNLLPCHKIKIILYKLHSVFLAPRFEASSKPLPQYFLSFEIKITTLFRFGVAALFFQDLEQN
jgi:hypothetical protein